MFNLTLPWWELILRGGGVYLSVILLLRLSGKRELGQLTPFDFVLLMLISEGASNALTAGDDSWAAAVIVITTMLLLNAALGILTTRFARMERWMEGRPLFLVRQGRVLYETLRRESISNNELMAALRQNGCFRPSQAEYAILETTGEISVKKRDSSESR
ncbi:MAG TPA: YetF domain-containing protein [Alphaproteobacteria bacterium]|jgi:uncharacterized membrane protein YcaP (DUF421 family)